MASMNMSIHNVSGIFAGAPRSIPNTVGILCTDIFIVGDDGDQTHLVLFGENEAAIEPLMVKNPQIAAEERTLLVRSLKK